jgi:MFS family permease
VLVLGAWAGLVADRSDKRRLLLTVQSFAMLQSFVMAALVFSGDPPLISIYAVAMLGGVATAFDNPARRAFVVEMVPDEDVQNAVSLNSALMTGARVVGPAMAGLLIVTLGYAWCFLVDGISYVAVLMGLWRIRTSELKPVEIAAREKGQIRAGLRYVRSDPDLFVPMVVMAIVGTFAMNMNVVIPLFVKESLQGSDTTFTLLYSVVSIGALAGALFAARRPTMTTDDAIRNSGWFGLALLAMGAMPNLAASFPAGLLLGFASVIFMTAVTTTVQVRTAPAMRGRVLALQAMLFLGSTPIGGPLVGWVSEEWGARAGFAVGGVACFTAAAWGLQARRRQHERSPEQPVLV